MLNRKSVIYTLAVTTLLLGTIFGTYAVSAQTQTPPATAPVSGPMTGAMTGTMPGPMTNAMTTTVAPVAPVTQAEQPVDSAQMAQAMATMMDQMEAMMAAAPDEAARQKLAPTMMNMINGMMGLNQAMIDQMPAMTGAERQAAVGPMMETMTRMTGMMGQMQGMTGGIMPMTSATPGSSGMDSGMQMGKMMGMMGQMMQMMGGGMMGESDAGMMDGGMMGSDMMDESAPISGTMPMSGTQSVGPMTDHQSHSGEVDGEMDDGMQMGQMMGMMGQMMQMMGQMHGMMDGGMMGEGMMGEGMGQMGSSSPMTGTVPAGMTPGSGPNMPAVAEEATQSVEGGSVTVKVTPLTLTDKTATTLNFEVVLETHSVELTYDLAQLAVLRDNLGNEYQPTTWSPDKSSGHHVDGLLSFGDRATILQTGVTSLELDVTGIAGIASRLFQWTVGK
ncbi:MAG: hypothetical protein KBG20_08330 [Caldilineaceae bacterium]|nr:hypothetical protein [Caldilineaceae bacterium]MBP8107675.1 hypothetical protein [Caldilineaceae bacterium]MBP8122903.1 hypothetical protein [Caldilineaceae bacterium]MBP9072290.1 hypothetical protein [Caldilineaceae bacterium]